MATIRKWRSNSKEIIPAILANENILYCEYDDGSNLYEFLLHKTAVNPAADLG